MESTLARKLGKLSLAAVSVWVAILLFFSATGWAAQAKNGENNKDSNRAQQIEFFESRIRPVLNQHCYACHNSIDRAEADFVLDWRVGIRTKSEHGTSVVPGKPEQSLLLQVISHSLEGLEMPEDGAKLGPDVIADFEKWIADGAVDPRETPPTESELKAATSWESTLASRKQWWSFQPIRKPALPRENHWSNYPIDRFVVQAIENHCREKNIKHLQPSDAAPSHVLVRRLTFALTGLPPTRDQLAAVESGKTSFEQLVDELLTSPQFGERWARHWMDLVRYADSHGSEGDPAIPNAYVYRDYLIRAFNDDVPYDDLVREHIAGDLLPSPRVNREQGINESMIGPAHWRLCFHGFAPTDALDEKVRFTDDQINVFSKAFLGLTVSCARCHNHKFDPISQADYYALFGIIGSCRPAMNDANSAEKQLMHQDQLVRLKQEIKQQLADQWLRSAELLSERILRGEETLNQQLANTMAPTELPQIWDFQATDGSSPDVIKSAWETLAAKWAEQKQKTQDDANANLLHWDLSSPTDARDWLSASNSRFVPTSAGEFSLSTSGDQIIDSVFPAGLFTNLISDRHRGVLGSPRFQVDEKLTAWMQLVGGGQSTARYVVQNFPRNGTVYPINEIKSSLWHWQKFDLEYWQGDDVHLEIVTAKDAPLQTRNADRSWFGVREVVLRKKGGGAPSQFSLEYLSPLFASEAGSPETKAQIALRLGGAASQAVRDWRDGQATDGQALFLNALVRNSVLPNLLESVPSVKSSVKQYRELESKIPLPLRVPGLAEAEPFDQPLFDRGNHRLPLEPVPRRFLEAIDASPYSSAQSGRLELANDLFRDDNPLTSRVIVNRIWHYLFGRGIVSTPDNFGRLGATPTHPELLDFLAARMVEEEWSIKQMIRMIVLSKTWQQSSVVPRNTNDLDPENHLLTHFGLRRLDAESVRDAIVKVSEASDDQMYGPGFPPDSNNTRRAIYVRSNRNQMDKFLSVFDSPIPFATTGSRNSTNVPAQSLTMLNSPFVIKMAEAWASNVRINLGPTATDTVRLTYMFESALGRAPSQQELQSLLQYLAASEAHNKSSAESLAKLQNSIADSTSDINSILAPIRQQLLAEKTQSTVNASPARPFADWDFAKGDVDLENGLKLNLKSGARIEDGALILDGKGFALSDPVAQSLGARTLEARVQLDVLKQQGGGVVTIQDLSGNTFDSIVFGEIAEQRWLAGSEFHRRTVPFGGPAEKTAAQAPVHLVISYAEDGTIIGYRDGQPYGKPIRKSNLHSYQPRDTQIALGIRHGIQSSAGRMLRGKIFQVRVYDRALSPEEISAAFTGQPWVSTAEVRAALEPTARQRVIELQRRLERQANSLKQLESTGEPRDPLARVAHAIFNLKEFIYVR